MSNTFACLLLINGDIMANPLNLDILFRYQKGIADLSDALKKSGKVDVSLHYRSELDEFKRNMKSAGRVPVILDYSAVIQTFKQEIDRVLGNVSISIKWENALVGLREALKKVEVAPIELRFVYRQQLERLRSEVANVFADIEVNAEFLNVDPTQTIKKIQDALNDPVHGLSMFNDQSRFNRAKLVKYIQRLIKEMDVISTNPDYSIHIPVDFGDVTAQIKEKLTGLEAGVTFPSVPIDTIEQFSNLTQKAISEFESVLAGISFDQLTTGLESFVGIVSDKIAQLPEDAQAAVDLIIEQFNRIKNFSFDIAPIKEDVLEAMRSLVVAVNDTAFNGDDSNLLGFFRELGGAISEFNSNPPSLDSINALIGALEGLAQGFSGVVTRADELMNGSFGRLMEALENFHAPDLSELQGAIQEMLQSFSESLTVHVDGERIIDTVGLIDAISVLVHSLQGLPDNFIIPFNDEMNTFIDRLSEVVSNIGGVQVNGDDAGASSNDSIVERINTNTLAILQLQRHLDEHASQLGPLLDEFGSVLVEQLREQGNDGRNSGRNGNGNNGNVLGGEGNGGGGNGRRGSERGTRDNYDGGDEETGLSGVLSHIRRFVRDLQQSGLQFPRMFVKTIATLEGIVSGYNGVVRHLEEIVQSYDDSLSSFSRSAESFVEFSHSVEELTSTTLDDLGLAIDQVLVDAEGNVHNLGDFFNELGVECRRQYEEELGQLRASGMSNEEAGRVAGEHARQHYQQRTQEFLNGGQEIRDSNDNVVQPDVLDNARQQASSMSDAVTQVFTQMINMRLGTLVRQFITNLSRQLLMLITRIGVARLAVIGGAAYVGVKALLQLREIHADNVKRAQVAWETAIKFTMDWRIRAIQQATEIEIQQINAVSEIERKRIENVREMNKNKLSMYSWELDMQRDLYDLEVERLQAQKQREVLQTKVKNIGTNADAAISNNKELNEGHLDWTYRGGFWNTIIGKQGIVDKYGNEVSQSVYDQAIQMRWFNRSTNGGWATKLSTEDYVKVFQSMAQTLERAGHEWFVSQVQPVVKANESFLSELTSLEAGGLMTDTELGYIDELISSIQSNTQALIEAERDMRFADTFTKYRTAEELVAADRAVYNERTNALGFYDGKDFILLGSGKTKEEAMEDANKNKLPELQLEAQAKQLYVNELKKNAKISSEDRVRIEALKEEDTKRKAARDYSEALIRQQNELKKTLADEITKFTSNSGAWNASNASKYAAQETIALRMQHATQLNDPRLIGNKDAEIRLRAYQDWESSKMTAKNELVVQQDWDKWLMHNITRDRAKFDLEQSQINVRHKLEMENIQAVAKVQIDNLNLQRDLIKRMMDHAVAQFKILNDPYGKNKYDTMKELNSIRIDRAYDARITHIKQENNTQNQEWEKKQKDAIQAKVERQEDLDFEEKWNLEEKLLEEKQKLEMELLKKEFDLRLKQIMIEVKYKHDLEEHYQKMREANTEAWLEGHTLLTDEELQAAGVDLSKYLQAVDVGNNKIESKVVLSDEERQRLSDNILSDQSEEGINKRNKVAELRQTRNAKGYEQLERMLKDRGVDVEAELNAWYEEKSMSDKKLQEILAAEKEAKENGEFRTVEQIAEANRYKHKALFDIAKSHINDGGVDNERKKVLEDRKAKLQAERDELYASKGVLSPEEVKARGEIAELVSDRLHAYNDSTHDWWFFADDDRYTDDSAKKEFMDKLNALNLSDEQKEAVWEKYIQKLRDVEHANTSPTGLLGFKRTDEDLTPMVTDVVDSITGSVIDAKDRQSAEKAAQIDDEIVAIDDELSANTVKDEEFDKLVKELEGYGDSETQAIMQQSELAGKIATRHDDYLAQILGALKNSGIEDVKKALEKNENERQKALEQQKQAAERRLEKLRTEEQSQLDIAKAQREDFQKGQIDSLEAAREIKKSVEETRIENLKRQDQFNADIVKREADYRQTQRGASTDFAISLMQSKSGMDRLKALSKYNSDSQYNAQTAAMDERHRAEMESLMRRGNFTEEEKAQLEARQQDEKSSLEESKKYADAIRDAMGDVGGIRSLVTEGTGNTSGLTETWERIQQAAFGHVEDAAADAVINMDRSQALQHAALMSLLTMQLPAISQAINNLNARNTINQYNQLNNMVGNPPTVGGWS